MKAGANNAIIENGIDLIMTALSPLVVLGIASYTLSSAIWLIILTRLPLSIAYPFGAISYVLVILGSALTGEYIKPARLIGVGLIVVGILLIGNSTNKPKS